MLTRRSLIAAGAALMPGAALAQTNALGALAASTGGRLGLAVYDTGTGRRLHLDPTGRYSLCSTVKLPLVAAILKRVDAGELSLAQMVRFGAADLLDHAPVARAAVAAGQLSLERLCAAAVVDSDNTAANLLFPQIGGPRGLTRFLRECGDGVTRSDRDEPTLNAVRGGEQRDTTTPAAMIGLMEALLVGDTVLSAASRARLIGWMAQSTTGGRRLRAGLPQGWRAGDKTGTSGEGYVNDVAIVTPPGRRPILIAAYLDAPGLAAERAEAAHARLGALIGQLFA